MLRMASYCAMDNSCQKGPCPRLLRTLTRAYSAARGKNTQYPRAAHCACDVVSPVSNELRALLPLPLLSCRHDIETFAGAFWIILMN